MVNAIRRQGLLFAVLIVINLLVVTGCLPRTYLIVDYQLPSQESLQDGRQVRLQVRDLRSDPQLMTPAAMTEFAEFNERFNLAWILPEKKRQRMGNYDLQAIFQEAFHKRMEIIGVHALRSGLSSAPLFLVEVNDVKVDLKDRNWSAHIRLRVSLTGESGIVATQDVSGSAQRAKILGRKGADQVLSELFTDIVNRVDIVGLFGQVGL